VKRTISPAAALTLALAAPAFASTPLEHKADRSQPPATQPPSAWAPTAPVDFTLRNGLKVRFVERHAVPLIDVVVQIGSGATSDPTGREGLANWTMDLLDEGAGGKGALELAGAVDLLGASLGTDAEWQRSSVSLRVPTARVDEAMGLLADVLLRPAFADADWQKKKKEAETAFLAWRDNPWALWSLARERALFGTHRLGLPRSGTPASLAAVKLSELKTWWAQHGAPDNATLFVVGDVSETRLRALLEKHLGGWSRAQPQPTLALPAPPRITGSEIVLIDKSGAPQSIVSVVARAPDGTDPLAADTDVMNTLLGGSFTSRLNQNLREEHQYSYGARSSFQTWDKTARMLAYAAVATPVTGPATYQMLSELRSIRSYVEDTEALRARRYLALTYPASFETGRAVAGYWAWAAAKGKSDAEVRDYASRVLRVGHRQVLEAGRRDVDMENMRVVIVGDARKIAADLKVLGAGPIVRMSVNELLGGPAPGP
jgi:zinc protease